MATISVGEVEAAIRLRDAVSPTIQAVSRSFKGGIGVTMQWTAAQQRAAMAMSGLHEEALKVNATITTTTGKYGAVADSVGRTSTTMARSATVFGLNADALRAVDDAADIAELGFNNLSKSAIGLNAATVGVVGAGFALGTMIGGWIRQIPGVSAALDKLALSLAGVKTNMKGQATDAGWKPGELDRIKSGYDALQKSTKDAIDSAREHGTSFSRIKEQYKDSSTEIKKYIKHLEEQDEEQKLVAKSTKDMAEALDKASEAMTKLSAQGEEGALREWEKADKQREAALKLAADAWKKLEEAALDAAKAGEEAAQKLSDADMAQGAEEAARSYEMMADELEHMKDTASALDDVFKGVGDTILQTFINGGNAALAFENGLSKIGQNVGEHFSKAIAGAIGGPFGKILGDLAGPVGALLGKGIGKLIGGLFGNKEIMQVNKLRDAFFAAQGGFQALAAKLAATDPNAVKRIFDAKTVEEFNAAVAAATGALDLPKKAFEDVIAATERWGLTIDQLGPKFAEQALHEQLVPIWQDFQLLIAAGADVNAVIAAMGPKLVEMVNQARASGASIPEAMRPMIQALIDSGQLVDDNGVAFTSAEDAGLSFTQTLEEGVQSLIDSIKDLVAALTGIPNIDRHVTITTTETGGGGSTGTGTSPPPGGPPHYAAGGLVTRPTYALIGESGPELIVPLGRSSFTGGAAGAGLSLSYNPTFQINGSGLSRRELVAAINEINRNNEGAAVTRMKQALARR